MILSRTYDFLFVHVPKTAGMAVSNDLSRFTTDQDLYLCEPWDERNLRNARMYNLSKHSAAAEIRRAISAEEFDPLFKFAFVRDPYARAYSLFRFLKYNFREWKRSAIMDTFDTFDQFVASEFFQEPGPDRIFEPQVLWLVNEQGQLMVDRVAHMEDIDSELSEIYAKIGLPPVEKVKPVNVSGRGSSLSRLAARLPIARRVRGLVAPPKIVRTNLSEIYGNEDTRSIVAARYLRDFDLFGYSSKMSDPGGDPRAASLAN
jgi:hypothetical protein